MTHIFNAALFALLTLFIGTSMPAHAAMSEWVDSEGGRMRLVAVSQPRNGEILALLRVEPKPGWKTYWRNPGDAGMPPQLNFGGSTNLVLQSVSFPVPEIGTDDGGRFMGYHEPVSLVVTFRQPIAGAPSAVNLDAIVGICETVCLPFMASFSVPLTPATPEGEEFMQLQLAQSLLPEKPSDDFAIHNLRFSDDRSALEAEITLPAAGTPQVAVVAPDGLRLGKPAIEPGVKGKTAHLRIPVIDPGKARDGRTVTMLVKSGGRAIEATLALQ